VLLYAGAQRIAFLALACFAHLLALGHGFLGARLALRRVLGLRAHLAPHAVAVLARLVLARFASLRRLGVHLARLRHAFFAGLGVLGLRAVEAALLRRIGLGGLRADQGTGRQQRGTDQQ
jgi:hypothetical protein